MMWVEELRLDNIKCFHNQTIRFARKDQPYPWITFLSENGGGKSTALQALALLLAGPDGAQKLLSRPIAWLHDEKRPGLISTRIHQGNHDPGKFEAKTVKRAFGYSLYVTGSERIVIRNRAYSEPTIVESIGSGLSWLRQYAFPSMGIGWFAVGYGAFRRLTRSHQIIVPSLEPQARFTNFTTQFNEEEALSTFEQWMVYLDYRISKANDPEARHRQEIGISAINWLLPPGAKFDRVTEEGRICFNMGGNVVPTAALSDGYRSILALAGDLVWRMMQAFPDSGNPLHEEGVVLIDELDIHLHPVWQRNIATLLRNQFPKLQFIVATHSPLIAAGAGEDALTLKFGVQDGKSVVEAIPNTAALSYDRVLQSEAFELESVFSLQTQQKIDKFDSLARKGARRNPKEEEDYQLLLDFMEEARPIGGPPAPGSLDARIDDFLQKAIK